MKGIDRTFFEIALYRCTLKVHGEDMETERKNYVGSFTKTDPDNMRLKELAERSFEDTRWYPWAYNDVIGWLSLYVDNDQPGVSTRADIKADFYRVTQKRILKRPRTKRLEFCGKAFQLMFDPSCPSAEIYSEVRAELERIRKEYRRTNRYLDLETIDEIGPLLNWRALLGFENVV